MQTADFSFSICGACMCNSSLPGDQGKHHYPADSCAIYENSLKGLFFSSNKKTVMSHELRLKWTYRIMTLPLKPVWIIPLFPPTFRPLYVASWKDEFCLTMWEAEQSATQRADLLYLAGHMLRHIKLQGKVPAWKVIVQGSSCELEAVQVCINTLNCVYSG